MRSIAVLTVAVVLITAACAVPETEDDGTGELGENAPTTASPATTSPTTTLPAESAPAASDSSTTSTTSVEDAAEPSGGDTTSTTQPPKAVPTTTPQTVPPSAGGGVVGEVPTGLLEQIIADALGKTGAERSQVTVQRAEFVVWSDGSLGCPEPGVSYTQALVDGYWVELDVAGMHFDYRASTSGSFKRCTVKPVPGGSG